MWSESWRSSPPGSRSTLSDLSGVHLAIHRLAGLVTGRQNLRGKPITQNTVLTNVEDIAADLLKWVEQQRNPSTAAPALSLEGLKELEDNISKMENTEIRKVLIRRGKVLREALESFGITPPPKPDYYAEVRRGRPPR